MQVLQITKIHTVMWRHCHRHQHIGDMPTTYNSDTAPLSDIICLLSVQADVTFTTTATSSRRWCRFLKSWLSVIWTLTWCFFPLCCFTCFGFDCFGLDFPLLPLFFLWLTSVFLSETLFAVFSTTEICSSLVMLKLVIFMLHNFPCRCGRQTTSKNEEHSVLLPLRLCSFSLATTGNSVHFTDEAKSDGGWTDEAESVPVGSCWCAGAGATRYQCCHSLTDHNYTN